MIEENSKRVGNLVELQCATRLYELGASISIPFGNSEKYDLLMDYNDRIYKIQCKHCQIYIADDGSDDSITFSCRWQGHNAKGYHKEKYTAEEVDYFATFYNGECYLVPQSECSNNKTLRIKPPKNNQKVGISFISDYSAREVLKQL